MIGKDQPESGAYRGEDATADDGDVRTGSADAKSAQETEFQAWLALGGHAVAMLDQLATLMRLELALTIADGKRLLLVAIAMIPLVLLAWIGFSTLIGWLIFASTASVALGLAGFLLLQLGVLALLVRAAQRFSRSLGFPASRRQLQTILKGSDPETGRWQTPA